MESRDTVVLIAELAVAIAGFSAVVVAVESRSVRNWSEIQRFNLRILLQVSALAIFFSIFPLIFERVVAPPSSWRWALWLYGFVHLADVSSFLFRSPRNAPVAVKIPMFTGFSMALASLAVAAFGSLLAAEVVYLSMLVWHLAVAAFGFAMLVFSDHSGNDA